jgi:hypothetical protein
VDPDGKEPFFFSVTVPVVLPFEAFYMVQLNIIQMWDLEMFLRNIAWMNAMPATVVVPDWANGTSGSFIGPKPNAQNEQLLTPALNRAVEALTNKDCLDLFGNEKTRQGDFSPVTLLTSLVNGNSKFGTVKFENKGSDWGVAKTYPAGRFPIPGLAGKVSITINTYNDGNLYWNDGYVDENAETLLHELGHAFNFLHGAGGFAISNLAEIKDPYAFDKRIWDKCFHK